MQLKTKFLETNQFEKQWIKLHYLNPTCRCRLDCIIFSLYCYKVQSTLPYYFSCTLIYFYLKVKAEKLIFIETQFRLYGWMKYLTWLLINDLYCRATFPSAAVMTDVLINSWNLEENQWTSMLEKSFSNYHLLSRLLIHI